VTQKPTKTPDADESGRAHAPWFLVLVVPGPPDAGIAGSAIVATDLAPLVYSLITPISSPRVSGVAGIGRIVIVAFENAKKLVFLVPALFVDSDTMELVAHIWACVCGRGRLCDGLDWARRGGGGWFLMAFIDNGNGSKRVGGGLLAWGTGVFVLELVGRRKLSQLGLSVDERAETVYRIGGYEKRGEGEGEEDLRILWEYLLLYL